MFLVPFTASVPKTPTFRRSLSTSSDDESGSWESTSGSSSDEEDCEGDDRSWHSQSQRSSGTSALSGQSSEQSVNIFRSIQRQRTTGRLAESDMLETQQSGSLNLTSFPSLMMLPLSATQSTRSYKSAAASIRTARTVGTIAYRGSKLVARAGARAITQNTLQKWKGFQSFRERHRVARQNPTVKWLEEKAEREEEHERTELERAYEARRRNRLSALLQERRREERRAERRALQDLRDEQEQAELDSLAFARKKEELWAKLGSSWHKAEALRKARVAAERAAAAEHELKLQKDEELRSRREEKRRALEQDHASGVAETLKIKQVLRSAGLAKAEPRPGALPTLDPPLETVQRLVITSVETPSAPGHQHSPQRPPSRKKKLKSKSSEKFSVDLSRYKVVVDLQGKNIGSAGGAALAHDLGAACCPLLEVLRLPYCKVGNTGMISLLRCFSKEGPGRYMHTLLLQGNALSLPAITAIGDVLKRGALPQLRVLDLSQNRILDEGGIQLAHQILEGDIWNKIEELSVRRNGMEDAGVLALYRALTAEGVRLSSGLRCISLRDNIVSRAGRAVLGRSLPAFLDC
jgi:hypothetical protein